MNGLSRKSDGFGCGVLFAVALLIGYLRAEQQPLLPSSMTEMALSDWSVCLAIRATQVSKAIASIRPIRFPVCVLDASVLNSWLSLEGITHNDGRIGRLIAETVYVVITVNG